MRSLVFAVAAILLVPLTLAGQLPSESGDDFNEDYWFDVFYPKIFFSSRDGFGLGGYVGFQQPVRFEDFDAPQPYRASVSVNAQATTVGSGFLFFSGRFPQFIEGWRFVGTLGVRRDARDDYFGIGSQTTYDSDNVTDANPHFYRTKQTRWSARVEAQRYITDDVRVLAGFDAQRWRFEALDGASQFASDVTVSINSFVGTNAVNDVAFRSGIIVDTRNDEVFAERGVLLQLIGSVADADIVGQSSYTRLTFRAQGHYPVAEGVSLAGRFVAQGMGGTPGLGSMYLIDEQEFAAIGFGGASSHRALPDNRFIGRHKMLSNFDVRYTLYSIPTLVRVTAIGFFDVGRVFEGEPFKITTDGLETGGGLGVFAQVGRVGILGFTAGVGPDGVVLDLHTRWPF